MNLFGSSQQSTDGGADLIFDIRSGSVGACLVTTDGDTPEIRWSTRVSVDFLAEHDTDRLLHMTQDALRDAVNTARDEGLSVLDDTDQTSGVRDVFCYFAAPWQVGSPQEITIENEDPFVVDTKKIQLAKEKAQRLFLDNAVNRFGADSKSLQPLTTALLSIWCNGYELDNPIGVSTDTLQASTYVSMLPERVKDLVEQTISDAFHLDRLSLHSFTASVQRAFSQTFSHPKTFLVVNVDEEMTQLLVVNSGVLMGSVSYPLGSHFLIRTLAKSLDVPAGDARSRLRQYQHEEAQAESAATISRIINESKNRWQELLVESLGEFSADVSMPSYAFVLASHATSASFADFTREAEVEEHLLTEASFRVHEVTDDLLSIHVQSKEEHTDHHLSIASLTHTYSRTDLT